MVRFFGAFALMLGVVGSAGLAAPVAAPIAAVDKAAEAARFEAASAEHNRARQRLGATRGFTLRVAPPLKLPALQEALAGGAGYPPGTAVLVYARQGDTLSAWLIDSSGIKAAAHQLIPASSLSARVAELRAAIGIDSLQRARAPRLRSAPAPQPATTKLVSATQASLALASVLLPPQINQSLSKVEHLVIVPVGDLGTVPFPALTALGDSRVLVERLSISIAPSLSDVSKPGTAWRSDAALARPLIVGDPALPVDGDWLVPPLPGAEAEAEKLSRLLDAKPLLGAAATKAAVASRAGSASLLYFATHGIADPGNPLDGGFLMLSGPTLKEGWWTAREIQNARLSAQLAVLSACQTGLGKAHDGGMIGLSRAFQLAGVPRVMMSLWNVDDAATEHLMGRMSVHLRDTFPAEALRRAMVETRRKYPEPALWSSFLLFGTPR